MKKSDAELVFLPFRAPNLTPRTKKIIPFKKQLVRMRLITIYCWSFSIFPRISPEFLWSNGDVQKIMQAETGKQQKQEKHRWSSFSKELLCLIQNKLLKKQNIAILSQLELLGVNLSRVALAVVCRSS